MDIKELKDKFDSAMNRWELAFDESNGRRTSWERSLSREAFDHYHRWRMALNEQEELEEKPKRPFLKKFKTRSFQQRPTGERCPQMDKFWKDYGEGHGDF